MAAGRGADGSAGFIGTGSERPDILSFSSGANATANDEQSGNEAGHR